MARGEMSFREMYASDWAVVHPYTCQENIFRWPKGRADAVTGWMIPPPTFCVRNPT